MVGLKTASAEMRPLEEIIAFSGCQQVTIDVGVAPAVRLGGGATLSYMDIASVILTIAFFAGSARRHLLEEIAENKKRTAKRSFFSQLVVDKSF